MIYNDFAKAYGNYLAKPAKQAQQKKERRKAREQEMKDLGLTKVKGAVSGKTYTNGEGESGEGSEPATQPNAQVAETVPNEATQSE